MKNRYDRLMGSGIECLCQKKESDKDHIVTVILLIVVLSFLFSSRTLSRLFGDTCGWRCVDVEVGGWRSFLSDVDVSFEHTRLSFLPNRVLYSVMRSKLSEDHIIQ